MEDGGEGQTPQSDVGLKEFTKQIHEAQSRKVTDATWI